MDLSIVIVNWNSREILKQCLASIAQNRGAMRLEVIVIDSGSFDGCGEMLSAEFPDVRFIQSPSNLGFAKANNEAARLASGRYLLFLNPDTEVVGQAIQLMKGVFDVHPNAGIVGVRLLNSDGSVQTSCIQSFPTVVNQILNSEALRRLMPRSSLWGMAPLFDGSTALSQVEGISGACLMLRRDVFASVGGFTEDYFMYAEDMDLAYKVKRAGFVNYYVPTATVIHYGGSSSGQAASTFTAVMLPEAIRRFLKKTRGRHYAGLYRAAMALNALVRLPLLFLMRCAARSADTRLSARGAEKKWTAILRWTMRKDGIVARYYHAPDESAASVTDARVAN